MAETTTQMSNTLGYAIFREGRQQAVERSLSLAKHWVEAEIVPLVSSHQYDALAETINAIAALCTYRHESKEDFIGRVRAALGDDPDRRVSEVRRQRDELLAALIGLRSTMACHDKTPEEYLALAAAESAIARVKGGAA